MSLFNKLNEFFTSFLDHVSLCKLYKIPETYIRRLNYTRLYPQALRELDYEVRDRHFLETVLDMEMLRNMSQIERTIFYNGIYNYIQYVKAF